jgi:hypothetical protein
MSRKGLCGRKRVVGFGVHNCSLPSAHFTRRIRRKGRSSDSVHIGLCAVRWPCSPHVIIIMLLYCSHRELVGTRFPLHVTSNLGPCCMPGLSTTPLILYIINTPFPPFFYLFFFRLRVNEPFFAHDHHTGNLYV